MARGRWILAVTAGGALLAAGACGSLGVAPNPSAGIDSPNASTQTGKASDLRTGETDRAWAYHPGAIRVRLAPGADIRSVLRKHSLVSASPLFIAPFSPGALAAGFDRAYRVAVRVGEEKQIVKRLALHLSDFEFVGLDYLDDVRQN